QPSSFREPSVVDGPVLIAVTLAAKKHHTPSPVDVPGYGSGIGGGVPWGFILILVGGVTAVGLVAYLSYLSTKRRRLGFQTMARQLGLDYSLRDPYGLLGLPFPLFEKGDGRGIANVPARARHGRQATAF